MSLSILGIWNLIYLFVKQSSFLSFFPVFTLLCLFNFVVAKIKNKMFSGIAIAIVLGIGTFFIVHKNIAGSVSMSCFTLTFVMVSVIYILGFIKLTVLEYAIIFACFAYLNRYINFTHYFFGGPIYILLLFAIILIVCKIRLKYVKGQLFNIWIAFVLTTVEGYFFEIVYNRFIRNIGYSLQSDIGKLFIWGLAIIITISLNIVLIYVIKRRFQQYFYEINRMGKLYPGIEKHFIYASICILLFTMLVHLGYVLKNDFDNSASGFLSVFSIFALLIQLYFLTLIFRVSYLKDNLQDKVSENQNLILYSSNLEKNLGDIRGIKHDIKNIFFTMGKYVEQSENEDMKAFYQSEISPFANEEITKNDLYGKLMTVKNEQLKAFLYYKISQAVERNITVLVDISADSSSSDTAMDFIDLIRIVGILMDNAIEECFSLANGVITIKISQNNELISYKISNTTDPQKKETGIKAGVSSKGDNRGNGLIIVQNIIKKYGHIALNSYFQEDSFVQSLNVYYYN